MSRKYYFSAAVLGWYQSDRHANMPEDAVEVPEATFVEFACHPAPSGKKLGSDSAGMPCWIDIVVSVADLKESKSIAINVAASTALAELSAAYPSGEVQSWAQQSREAEALAGDPDASAPLLTAISTARGVPLGVLAERVRAKVVAYASASGAIIGQRQALEDAINAVNLDTPDAAERLAAIHWPEVTA